MKLLLDEMHAPTVAAALTAAGVETVAVAASPEIRGLADPEVLTFAAGNDLTLVTENVADFSVLHGQWLVAGRSHSGLVFTSPKRFNRAVIAYPGSLVVALQQFAARYPDGIGGTVVWLV